MTLDQSSPPAPSVPPAPPMPPTAVGRPLLVGEVVRTACLVIVALCVTGAALAMLKQLVTPLLVAVFLFFLMRPAVESLSRRKAPPWAIVSFFAIALLAVVMAMVQVVYSNVRAFEARIPEYRTMAIRTLESYYRMTGISKPGAKNGAEGESEPAKDEDPSAEPDAAGEAGAVGESQEVESDANAEATVNAEKPTPPQVPAANQEASASPGGGVSESPVAPPVEEPVAESLPDDLPPGESSLAVSLADPSPSEVRGAGTVEPSAPSATPPAGAEPSPRVPSKTSPRAPPRETTLSDLIEFPWQDAVQYAFGSAVGFLEGSITTLFYLVFLFLEAHKLPRRIARGFPQEDSDRYLRVGQNINDSIARYVALKTYINFGLAFTTGLICMLFDLDFWILWAVVAFVANYITYLGSVAALAPPIVLAFLQFGPGKALAITTLLVLNRLAWIDYVEIRILGRQLNVSPIVLLFSIALFGFLWGTAGMILAVPLVTSAKIVLSHFENTQRYAVLISED